MTDSKMVGEKEGRICDNCIYLKRYRTGADEYPEHTTLEYCGKGHWENGSEQPEPGEPDYWINCIDFTKK